MGFRNFKNVEFNSRWCGNRQLRMDEACVEVTGVRDASFWRQYAECSGCPLVSTGSSQTVLRAGTAVLYEVRDVEGTVCNGTAKFGEYGRYTLNASRSGCNISILDQPDEPLFPLLAALVVALLIATSWYIVKATYRRINHWSLWNFILRRPNTGSEMLLGSPYSSAIRRPTTRLKSTDVFRGITIALMIFVNYGGGGYSILRHTPWNGLTFADLVFPWFAWLMGFSLHLSLHTRLRTAMKRRTALFQIVKRSIILICIGIILSSKNCALEDLRIPGVLQRLGLSYMIVGIIECFAIDHSNNYLPGASLFRDLRATWWQWSSTFMLVAIQLVLTFLLPVPDCPRGYLGPGGLHNNSFAMNCTGGAAGYIDNVVFGKSHLHRGGSFRNLYHATAPFDPEGLLGTFSCVLVVQLGVQAARVLLAYSHARARVLRWLLWSIVTGAIAGGLCQFSVEKGPLPINKNLWSVSYCLATSSTAFMIQALLYVVIDMYGVWQGRPFYYAGRNALLMYIGHDLMKGRVPFEWKLEYPTHMELLAMNLLAVILWLFIAVFLHRKNIILTV